MPTTLDRRDFLTRSAATVGVVALGGVLGACDDEPDAAPARAESGGKWAGVKAEFELSDEYVQLAAPILAAHPRAVREAIEIHRKGLDTNTRVYMVEHEAELDERVLTEAASYLGTTHDQIALTDSTTMGLGLLYGGISVAENQEILTTAHDHYATHEALRLRATRTGARLREVQLFDEPGDATTDSIVDALMGAVTDKTRVVAVTWVHSVSGMKLPIRALADALAEANRGRSPEERALLCVDGVHGLGVDASTPDELGCDFLIAGTHKWMWGPRGTGIVWGSSEAWAATHPTIPTFDGRAYVTWIQRRGELGSHSGTITPPLDDPGLPPGPFNTPGGYHSFEHRWALADAFAFMAETGPGEIAQRTTELATRLKDGLTEAGLTLYSPTDPELSGGLVVARVDADPYETVDMLLNEHKVVASVTPYAEAHLRFAPSIVTDEDDIDAALEAITSTVR